jgi:hypothetical protein
VFFASVIYVLFYSHTDHSWCVYDDEQNNKKFGIRAEDLLLIKARKYVRSRIKGRQHKISYAILQTNEYDMITSDTVMTIETVL